MTLRLLVVAGLVFGVRSSYSEISTSDFAGVSGDNKPIEYADQQEYDLPICQTVYQDENHWSEWSECSTLCGSGTQSAVMNLQGQQKASFLQCEIRRRVRPCTGTICPQDCVVDQWSSLQPCDAKTGFHIRLRNIIVPPVNNGKECPLTKEIIPCPVDCKLSEWSSFSKCDNTTGQQRRSRSVVQRPLNNGTECGELENFLDCDINCEVYEWGEWSICDQETGIMFRSRNSSIESKNGGSKCLTYEKSKCLVDCEVGAWREWGECDELSGIQTRDRLIRISSKNGGKPCGDATFNTNLIDYQSCNVDCKISEWEDWGDCDNATGVQKRVRHITTIPKNDGVECPSLIDYRKCAVQCVGGEWYEYGPCDAATGFTVRRRTAIVEELNGGPPCTLEEKKTCAVDGEVGPWSSWSTCSTINDGKGTQSRTRVVTVTSKNGGAALPPIEEHRTCTVDCHVGVYTEFGPCDNSTGLMWRTREIIVPSINNGNSCPPLSDSQNCDVDCLEGSWGAWSECNVESGTKTRKRDVLRLKKNGGRDCLLSETQDCPVSCQVTSWSEFDDCDVQTGLQHRSRSIVIAPLNGGQSCPSLQENISCKVECEISGWLEWSSCNKISGMQSRSKNVTVYAKNGGNNSECFFVEMRPCSVDCEIGTNGSIVVQPINGGKSCFDVASVLSANGANISSQLYNKSSQVNLEAATHPLFKFPEPVSLGAIVGGTLAMIIIVGLFISKRSSNEGYQTIAHAV